MNSLCFMLLHACSFWISSKDQPHSSVWKHIDPVKRDSFEVHEIKKNEEIIPFIWFYISDSTLNNVIDEGIKYDSLYDEYVNGRSDLPMGVIKQLDQVIILYGERTVVKVENCQYEVFSFLVNEGEGQEFNADACYKFYYIKDIGIVACIFTLYGTMPFDWEKYYLADVLDEKNKSLINKKTLQEIIDKATSYYDDTKE